MFKLVRWLFLLGIIAALAGFLVGKPIHGKTPAESFCKLIDNADCFKLASRTAVELAWARDRWESAAAGPSQHTPPPAKTAQTPKSAEASPSKTAPIAEPAVGEAPTPLASAPPLDRHTVAERQALDKILTQRGSR